VPDHPEPNPDPSSSSKRKEGTPKKKKKRGVSVRSRAAICRIEEGKTAEERKRGGKQIGPGRPRHPSYRRTGQTLRQKRTTPPPSPKQRAVFRLAHFGSYIFCIGKEQHLFSASMRERTGGGPKQTSEPSLRARKEQATLGPPQGEKTPNKPKERGPRASR